MSTITIRDGLIVTQDAKRRILRGSVVIEDSVIASVGAKADKSDVVIDAGDRVVLPGLINMHTHVGMSMLRGMVPNDNLDVFLKKTSEFDSRNTKEMIEVSTLLGAEEMLMSGTTSFLDLYYSEDVIADAVAGTGLRAYLSWVALDEKFTTQKGVPIKNAEKFLKGYAGKPLVTPSVGLQGVYVCSKDTVSQAFDLAKKYDTIVHMHLSETMREVHDHAGKYGERPVAWMGKNGFLSDRLVAAHCVWLEDAEMIALAKAGATPVYNPISNARLGSGVADVKKMLKRRIHVAIGTDSTASNDNLDLLQDMKFGALINNLAPQDVLDMATVNAAKALRLDAGSIESGKKADIILLDRAGAFMSPTGTRNAVSNIVYAAEGRSVSISIIDGKVVLDGGVLLSKKFDGISEKAGRLAENLWASAK